MPNYTLQQAIIEFLQEYPNASAQAVHDSINSEHDRSSTFRSMKLLVEKGLIVMNDSKQYQAAPGVTPDQIKKPAPKHEWFLLPEVFTSEQNLQKVAKRLRDKNIDFGDIAGYTPIVQLESLLVAISYFLIKLELNPLEVPWFKRLHELVQAPWTKRSKHSLENTQDQR